MKDKVLEFIHRRFQADCNWTSGNCYYFALMLKDRFKDGVVYYDVIDGHFVLLHDGRYYDWTGIVQPDEEALVEWDRFDEYDPFQKERIISDCLL